MKKWSYFQFCEQDFEKAIARANNLGEDGWELVAVLPATSEGSKLDFLNVRYFFKKPVE
jgi:hypothetical protein